MGAIIKHLWDFTRPIKFSLYWLFMGIDPSRESLTKKLDFIRASLPAASIRKKVLTKSAVQPL